MKRTIALRKSLGTRPRDQTVDELMQSGTAVIGSPRTVRERFERMREKTGLNRIVTMLQFGVLDNERTRRNMELFAAEVLPHFRG
jgi:alkanesulfonate monooxygenase SsuD/methylene tetrahydromethanopterin reductase-like flavin-dependent oxidoreductase (luciferase family)